MHAAIVSRYGSPEVVGFADIAPPTPGPGEILVRVVAAGVTTADWRVRAAAFPGLVAQIAGRAMFGVTRPRRPVLGSDFAGTVAAVGPGVTEFVLGDRVFGFAGAGAHAEYLTVKAEGAVTKTPEALSDIEAAALPFGGLAALEFLDRFAGLRPGERVLILGATGGVGAYAVQIAKALGAEVTAVASGGNADLARDLGADAFVDYRAGGLDRLQDGFDAIFDTVGAWRYPDAAPRLAPGGRFLPLNFRVGDLFSQARAKRAGHRVILQVNADSKAGIERLAGLAAEGRLCAVIDRVYPFAELRAAYARVETRHRAGATVLDLAGATG